jgi:hypothetical protein
VVQFEVLCRHLPVGTEEKKEKSQDSRFPDRGLKPGTPVYEAGVVTTHRRYSVSSSKLGLLL